MENIGWGFGIFSQHHTESTNCENCWGSDGLSNAYTLYELVALTSATLLSSVVSCLW